MPGNRDRALDAALEILGTRGIRALSHGRVDEYAGLPKGSTSNYFRTRAALISGAVDWLAQQELRTSGADLPPSTPAELVDALCALLADQVGPHRARTLARYVLFLEGTHDDEVLGPMLENRRRFEAWMEDILRGLGAHDPVSGARTMLAIGNGLVLHHLSVDPDYDPRPSFQAALRGILPP